MTLLNACLKYNRAFERVKKSYPVMEDRHLIKTLQVINLACEDREGVCSFHDIRMIFRSFRLSRVDTVISREIGNLVEMGFVVRKEHGRRFQYYVTMQGILLLNDFEKALKAVRV